MGGMFAPLIALELPVKGIAVYGSGAATWFEAVFEQRRRLASLDGTKPNEINREILDQARFWSALLIERKTPREILGAHPELERLGWVVEDKYVGDRHYTFHSEVADKNFTDAWTKVAATRLATSTAAKATHPRVLTNSHSFFHTVSTEESYRIFAPPEGPAAPARVFNPILLETLRAWLNETAASRNSGVL